MIELHGSLDLCERRKYVNGQEVDGSSGCGIRIHESSFGIELGEDKEDGMNRNAGDVLLKFNAKLGEGRNVFNCRDLFEADNGRCSLELGGGSLDEGRIELSLVRGRGAEAFCFGDDLHYGRFEFDVGAFSEEEVSYEVVVGTRGRGKIERREMLVRPGGEGAKGIFKTADAHVVVSSLGLKLGCESSSLIGNGDSFSFPFVGGSGSFGLSLGGDGGELEASVGDRFDDIGRKIKENGKVNGFKRGHDT